MSDLLKTSIADAKAVREAALANARSFLEEQFNSSLQNMFTQKLSEELNEDEDDNSEIENLNNDPEIKNLDDMLNNTDQVPSTSDQVPSTSDQPVGDEIPSVESDESDESGDGIPSDEEITNEELDEILQELSSEINESEHEEMNESEEDENELEEEIDLNELLNELEETSYSDMNEETEETPTSEFDTIAEGADSEEEDEEDEEDEYKNEDVTVNEMASALVSINEENQKLKKTLKEHIDTIHELKKVLSETNLLNAKLLYTNKLFKGKSLTESQKLKVIDTFDLTKSIREVKLAYSVLAESFNFGGSVVKPKKTNTTARRITEGLASKPVKSTAPIVEPQVDEMASRLQKLAGITK